MYPLRNRLRALAAVPISASFAVFVIVLGLAVPAHADDVKTDYNHSASFSDLHTFTIGQIKTANPFYVDRVRQAITSELSAKGWQQVPSGGDVTIFATGTIQDQQQLETMYNGLGGWGGRWGWGGWGWGRGAGFGETTTTTYNTQTGHLVVDIFRSNSKDLLWRGVSSADISKKAEKNTSNLNKDIHKMFEKFPPKVKS